MLFFNKDVNVLSKNINMFDFETSSFIYQKINSVSKFTSFNRLGILCVRKIFNDNLISLYQMSLLLDHHNLEDLYVVVAKQKQIYHEHL